MSRRLFGWNLVFGWKLAMGAALAWSLGGFGVVALRAADAPPDASGAAGSLFDRLDTNHDGSLTAEEVPADKRALFDRLLRSSDQDKSGSLSRQELIEGLKNQRPQRELEDKSNPPAAGPAGLPDPEQLFNRLDANGDGKVTADEVPPQAQERFEQLLARADKNNDSAISKQEMIDGVQSFAKDIKAAEESARTPAGVFKYLDANGDNRVTVDEVPAERREGFERLMKIFDKNHDGGLNEDEFVAAANAMKLFQGVKGAGSTPSASSEKTGKSETAKSATPSAGGEPAADAKPSGGKGARLAKLQERGIDADRFVDRLMKGDKSGDGKLSRDELPEAIAKRFDKLDTNSDGVLDESEVRAGVERLKKLTADLKN